jgi:hypothetical protein
MQERASHGSRSFYNNGRCRDSCCREANALYFRELRRRYRPKHLLVHGSNSTYVNRRCRCEDCSRAHAAAGRVSNGGNG